MEQRQASRSSQDDRRATWQGLSDGMTHAMEMALVPVMFALIGLYIDGRLGTRPGFTLGLFVFGMVGSFLHIYYHAVARFDALERNARWRRTREGPAKATAGSTEPTP